VAVFPHELSTHLGNTQKLSLMWHFWTYLWKKIVIKHRFEIVSEKTKKRNLKYAYKLIIGPIFLTRPQ
jgi:hypothetical protein